MSLIGFKFKLGGIVHIGTYEVMSEPIDVTDRELPYAIQRMKHPKSTKIFMSKVIRCEDEIHFYAYWVFPTEVYWGKTMQELPWQEVNKYIGTIGIFEAV